MIMKDLIKKRANWFLKFFIDNGPNIVSIIPESQIKFDLFLNLHQTILGGENLKGVLKSLKPNKNPGYVNLCLSRSQNFYKKT